MAAPGKQNSHYIHGMTATSEWRAWASMIARCEDATRPGYHRYGGRGIRVCREWRTSFITFFECLGPRPSPKHSLDRIDNDKGYAPGNVRWATRSEQRRNCSDSRYIEAFGKRLIMSDWAAEIGIGVATLSYRLNAGWAVERALSTPARKQKQKL